MSILDVLEPFYKWLPEVKSPEVQPPLKKKLMWSGLVLVIFFVMGSISVIGLDQSNAGQLQALQLILASNIGTLVTVGIGPIVLASIILQLLVGGKILNIDLSVPAERARFTSLQKLFAIVLSFFEAAAYTGMGIFPGFLTPAPGMFLVVVLQVALGAILLIYLDEIVSKYGIGSGIGLFIAGGVAGTVIWRIFAPPIGPAKGILLLVVDAIGLGQIGAVVRYILPIIFTLVIFFVVVFAEGIHVNIPITMGTKGMGGRFPVKFLYVSNLPVILAVALYANIQIMGLLLQNVPVLSTIVSGISWVTTVPSISNEPLLQGLLLSGLSATAAIEILHAVAYVIVFVVVCVVLGKFWVEMAGQGPTAVSEQLNRSGMYVPGFRRDPRIIKGILDRYIPPISILGAAFVALLAALADLTGALGSGTGILLTVGIVYRLYEDLARQQAIEAHPLLKRLFGG